MNWLSILNLVLSAVNAYFAYDAFKHGENRSGYFNLSISAICFVGAVI